MEIMMKKKNGKQIVAAFLITCVLGGCGLSDGSGKNLDEIVKFEEDVENHDADLEKDAAEEIPGEYPANGAMKRPSLLNMEMTEEETMVTPNAAPYTIESDLSNVENLWQFYMEDDLKEKLAENGFIVWENGGDEFYEGYEWNRYSMIPNFVTVDSMMHTYHLYFSYLMKNIEKEYLADDLSVLSVKMAENSAAQYEVLKGTEWEEAAVRNVAFFTVGARLSGADITGYDYAEELVSRELNAINNASGIADSAITGRMEDYSQYIPRGYYEGDELLERYFKTMMWYGRIHFIQEKEELNRSALLMTMALTQDAESYKLWESTYAVTSFFAGASDDSGVCEYASLIKEAYGEGVSVGDLTGNKEAFDNFHAMTAVLEPPQINSIPIMDGEDNTIRGFRFMGQRFTIDAAIMQNLIYQNVGEDAAGNKRMLPDVLDVPAALGSDTALEILEEQGDTGYQNYMENLKKLKESLSGENKTLWNASLYANWLNTLRPLLDKKGDGYPVFMQNEEWAKKDLECFAGSFTELKHDTVLYTKQVIAEMGGGMEEEPDDRGYVEPEPLVYARFYQLASLTAEGLKRYDMLNAGDEENLIRLAEMAEKLLIISNKELQNEVLTEDEYEFIRCYGGNLEHFWIEAVKNDNNVETPMELPAAVVTDIATDPNGQVLEIATGIPSSIYVVVNVDGKIKIARGSVYTFYQFPWAMEDRLTDSKWRYMMRYQADENGNWLDFEAELPVKQPEWTQSYRK
ncbi:MAG: DUF3160 domain-containing protein [Lachnospiraceae bacterium]|nr:DUF3160 domain-containing protein [Lachnospiraceae bacterium]